MLLETYKLCDYKIQKFEYENVNVTTEEDQFITLNVKTNISANLPDNKDKSNEINGMIEIEHIISNKDNTFKLIVNILNFVYLKINQDKDKKVDLSQIIEKNCLPDLLYKSREKIKELSVVLNLSPIELAPFSLERIK